MGVAFIGSFPEFLHYRRVMVFIDGRYLIQGLKDLDFEETHIIQNIKEFSENIINHFFKRPMVGELIRVYWYDAKYNEKDKRLGEQEMFFNTLRDIENFEVKLGEIVITEKGEKQKGVDVLIAVDMLTKAYEHHYDIAIFVCGNRDSIPLVKAVKDQAGKRVYGVFFERSCSLELRREFDRRSSMIKEENKIKFS